MTVNMPQVECRVDSRCCMDGYKQEWTEYSRYPSREVGQDAVEELRKRYGEAFDYRIVMDDDVEPRS